MSVVYKYELKKDGAYNSTKFVFERNAYTMAGADYGWYSPNTKYEGEVWFSTDSKPVLSEVAVHRLARSVDGKVAISKYIDNKLVSYREVK